MSQFTVVLRDSTTSKSKIQFFHANLFLPSPQLQTLTYFQYQLFSHRQFSDTMKQVVAEVLVEIFPLDDSAGNYFAHTKEQ